MADEALASFQLLLKSIPSWISDLENILNTATQHQTDLVATEQPARKSTASLTKSLESARRQEDAVDDTSEPTLLHQQRPHLTGSDFLRLSQRKRKTASVCSRVESQPSKYRSRNMVVVYYDSNAQKAFETLVRAIGTSRNSIRKSKLGMSLDSLGRSGSSSSSGEEETIKGLGNFRYRTTNTLRRPVLPIGKGDDIAVFDRLDGVLEKAQGFCEHAAHQILRDGDCGIEITKAKDHFTQAVEIVNAELPDLVKKAEKSLARRVAEDKKYALEDERRPSQYSAASNDSYSLPSDGMLEVDTDEVVDDSDSEEFDISTMKLPPRLSKYTLSRPQLPSVTAVH